MAKHTRSPSDEQRKRLDVNRETMLFCLTEPSAFAHMHAVRTPSRSRSSAAGEPPAGATAALRFA